MVPFLKEKRLVKIAIDTSQLTKQVKTLKKAFESNPLLLEYFSEYILSSLFCLPDNLIFSESKATVATDGIVKIINTIRLGQNIEFIILTLWAHKRSLTHK